MLSFKQNHEGTKTKVLFEDFVRRTDNGHILHAFVKREKCMFFACWWSNAACDGANNTFLCTIGVFVDKESPTNFNYSLSISSDILYCY